MALIAPGSEPPWPGSRQIFMPSSGYSAAASARGLEMKLMTGSKIERNKITLRTILDFIIGSLVAPIITT